MKISNCVGKSMIVISFLVGIFFINNVIAEESEFSFTVHNSTEVRIVELLVSEDKQDWGPFDIGSGIAPGAEVELVWDSSTNNESCHQYVKAVYADDSEADPAKFNFCEADLQLQF